MIIPRLTMMIVMKKSKLATIKMIVTNPDDYDLKGFKKSSRPHKKYDAILINKKTGVKKEIPFGDTRYDQYRDSTPLRLYSNKDHHDENRKKNYLSRHEKDSKNKFSSGWFSANYLWK